MAQLRQDYDRFKDKKVEIIAIGPEDVKAFAEYWHKEKMPFTGIPDPKHVVAGLYGQKVNPLKLGRMPALVIIDKAGRIRHSHYGESMSDIVSNQEVFSWLDKLNKEH